MKKKAVIILSASIALIVLPLGGIYYFQTYQAQFYNQHDTALLIAMGVCLVSSLFLLFINRNALLMYDLMEKTKKGMMTDRPFFEYTGTQRTKQSFVAELNSNLQKDRFKCQQDFLIGNHKIELYAVKKQFSLVKDSLSRTVFVIYEETDDINIFKDRLRDIIELLNTSKERIHKASCRAGIVLFITPSSNTDVQEYMKEIKYYDSGALLPACLDFKSSKVYFMGGKTELSSSERYAQKLIAKYILGYKNGKLPKSTTELTEEQLKTLSKIENFNFKGSMKKVKEEQKEMFSFLKDKEFRISFDDEESGSVYYKENENLLSIPFTVDEKDKKHLILFNYEYLVWDYPRNKEIKKAGSERIVANMKKYLTDNGYTFEQDF